jgi:hypothetical protein
MPVLTVSATDDIRCGGGQRKRFRVHLLRCNRQMRGATQRPVALVAFGSHMTVHVLLIRRILACNADTFDTQLVKVRKDVLQFLVRTRAPEQHALAVMPHCFGQWSKQYLAAAHKGRRGDDGVNDCCADAAHQIVGLPLFKKIHESLGRQFSAAMVVAYQIFYFAPMDAAVDIDAVEISGDAGDLIARDTVVEPGEVDDLPNDDGPRVRVGERHANADKDDEMQYKNVKQGTLDYSIDEGQASFNPAVANRRGKQAF